MNTPMNIRRKTEKGIANIWFNEKCVLDVEYSQEENILKRALSDNGVTSVVVDMTNVETISTKAIGMLQELVGLADTLGKTFAVTNVSKDLAKILGKAKEEFIGETEEEEKK